MTGQHQYLGVLALKSSLRNTIGTLCLVKQMEHTPWGMRYPQCLQGSQLMS